MLKKEPFGQLPTGESIDLYTLTNSNGMKARIMTYGGTVVSLTAPDKSGKFADVILGMDDQKAYTTQTAFLGALIGRYGNRIGNGKFKLEGKEYVTLPRTMATTRCTAATRFRQAPLGGQTRSPDGH